MKKIGFRKKRPTGGHKHHEARLLPRLSVFFFKRPLLTAGIWLILLGFGIASYTTLMGRQGFPPVQAPLSIVQGTYLVDDAQKVDTEISEPISAIALRQKDVKTVTATANSNTFSLFVQYQDGTEPKNASQSLEKAVKASGKIPKNARVNFQTIDVAKFSPQGEGFDMLIALYGTKNQPIDNLVQKAQVYSDKLNSKNLSLLAAAKVLSPYSEGVNPTSGQSDSVQTSFDRYGERVGDKFVFHQDVVIGLQAREGADTVKFYNQVKSAVDELNNSKEFTGYRAAVTAAFAPSIEQEINELQRTLLEGLIAILIIGTILVTLRASLLIITSMATVIAITLGALFLLGYTLNVITLFAIILGLALIVDDTIIMTEALDAERRRQKNALNVVKLGTRKVSLAMLAATSTAILGFAPLLFITGILGGFIRPIPVTIIISLVVSLLVALIVIPFLAHFLILRKNNIGPNAHDSLAVRLQESFAHKLTAPLRWTKHSSKRLWATGIVALVVGFSFIFGGAYIFKYLTFNIFPSNKDSNQLMVTMEFPAGTDIAKAESVAGQADAIIADTLGSNLKQLAYYASGSANQAQVFIELTSYTERNVTAPQLVDKLKGKLNNFKDASFSVSQQDTGGPPGSFNVLIQTPDRASALALAGDMAQYLNGQSLKRPDGSSAHIVKALVFNPDAWLRKDNKQLVQVTAQFDGSDTSTLVTLAQNLVKAHYSDSQLAKYHLNSKNLVYDFGFEDENQKSFNSMLIAFPILLVIMYIVLAIEFRSLLQPLLIFMAIPFSFFGVAGGLWLTDNPFSFFTMLGFFALIGLSIKNTILLTDYANQARRAGLGRVDSIVSAVEERFRPLLATSATAVFSLLPLALTSPFWESLAYTLIFGLLSSTMLVILVFPYYYLGGEYLRMHISRGGFIKWLLLNVLIVGAASMLAPIAGLAVFFVLNVCLILAPKLMRRN